MNLGLFSLAIIQSAILALGQVTLKFGLMRMEPFGWTKSFWISVFTNWQFALCGGNPVNRGLDKGYQFPGGLFVDLADLGLGDCRGRVVSRLASDPDHAR